MSKPAKQQDSNSVTRPSVALEFVKSELTSESKEPTAPADVTPASVREPEPENRPAPKPARPARKRQAQVVAKAPAGDSGRAVYEPFSTLLRRDLKLTLKRLAFEREQAGSDSKTVKQFVEEAIVQWVATQAVE